jgi:DNA-binding PucR family transcriptional regulator
MDGRALSIAALVLAVANASAQQMTERDAAGIAAALDYYDTSCTPLSPYHRQMMRRLFVMVPQQELVAARLNVEQEVQRLTLERWCAMYRPPTGP